MLVQFGLRNYRSFADYQVFSMSAASNQKGDSRFRIQTGNKSAPELLKTSVIFGQNGSGKSNLLSAMVFVDQFVLNSAKNMQLNDELNIAPFKFDWENGSAISEFEIVFIANGTQYQYGLTADNSAVHDEWMFRILPGPRQRAMRMFERTRNEDQKSYDYYINPALKGAKDLWRDSTRPNASFFSTAVQLSAEPFLEPFNWFSKQLQLYSGNRTIPDFSADLCSDQESKDFMLSFLQAADLGIVDVLVEEMEGTEVHRVRVNPLNPSVLEVVKGKRRKISVGHKMKNGRIVYLDLNEESDGTRVLFSLVHPWYQALRSGRVVVIDELSNSLHPLVLAMLVDAFNDPKLNQSSAQLIFTSHETIVLEQERLARDQINIIQRNSNLASEIVPLTDFSPRSDENFRRGYLQGRYSGVPIVGGI